LQNNDFLKLLLQHENAKMYREKKVKSYFRIKFSGSKS